MKRYQVTAEVTRDSSRVVDLALRLSNKSQVMIIKPVLPSDLNPRELEELVRRFNSMAKEAFALNHSGVVRVVDSDIDDGEFFIASEVVDGVSLGEKLEFGIKLDVETVLDIIRQAIEILAFAHQNGVVHLNLSTSNIFLQNDGRVRISEFGLAIFTNLLSNREVNVQPVNSLAYKAPEQLTGQSIDPRTDIFSLGCVFYELLTGKPAFTGNTVDEIKKQILEINPPLIRRINPDVSEMIEEIVFRMLAKDPVERNQSVTGVKLAIQRIIAKKDLPYKSQESSRTPGSPYLLGISGPYKNRQFEILPSVTTIGRSASDILLTDEPDIAIQHAWISRDGDDFVLFDATNDGKTLLNREPITKQSIFTGDQITIGTSTFEFHGPVVQAAKTTPVVKQAVRDTDVLSKAEKLSLTAAESAMIKHKSGTGPTVLISIAILVSVIIGFVVGFQVLLSNAYMMRLNSATNKRWVLAMSDLYPKSPIVGTSWNMAALRIIQDWDNSMLPEADFFKEPAWLPGSERFNGEVDYRLELLSLFEQFLNYSVTESEEVNGMLVSSYSQISGLERLIEACEVPPQVTTGWGERKDQLKELVRDWKANNPDTGDNKGNDVANNRLEASSHLVSGWTGYQNARGVFENLEKAFNEFQYARQSSTLVLDATGTDAEASSVRGLASFLAAKVLNQTGDKDHRDRWTRALDILDEGYDDVDDMTDAAYGKAIPADLKTAFPDIRSLKDQIVSLRDTLNKQLAENPANPLPPSGPEGHYRPEF
jgi:serine/threonine protein kinase